MTNSTARSPAGKKTFWAWTIATFFGVGFWRPGPGTAGSIAAAAIWWLAGYFTTTHPAATTLRTHMPLAWMTAAAALVLLIVGVPASAVVARESGRKDPQCVVADEAVGQWIALLAAPANWKFALVGLVLFRTFDIWKPPPIRRIEYLPGGWGIMLDDVAAGVYALIVFQILYRSLR